jgi:hypothetical protein
VPAALGKKGRKETHALAEYEARVRELMAPRPDLPLDELHRSLLRATSTLDVRRSIVSCTRADAEFKFRGNVSNNRVRKIFP